MRLKAMVELDSLEPRPAAASTICSPISNRRIVAQGKHSVAKSRRSQVLNGSKSTVKHTDSVSSSAIKVDVFEAEAALSLKRQKTEKSSEKPASSLF